MADINDKVAENVEGPFFVTNDCVGCGLCIETAPENFVMNEDDSCAYVVKQPENDEEKSLCQESVDSCPSDSIGADGDNK